MSDLLEHNDFEKRLKKAADDFLPKPSGTVWENVRDELHPRNRTFLLAAAAVILLLLAVGVYFLQKSYTPLHQKSSVARQAMPAHAPGPIPSPNDNKPLSPQNTIQPSQQEVISGSSTAKTFHKNPLNKANQEKNIQGNNSVASSFYGKKEAKSHQKNFQAFNKNNETRQTSGQTIENQMAEISGLPYLTNLSAVFNFPSLPSEESLTASFLSQYENYENSTSLMANKEIKKLPPPIIGKRSSIQISRKPSFEIFYTPAIGYRTLTKGSSGILTSSSSSMYQLTSPPQYPPSALSSLKQQPEWSWAAGARIAFPFGRTWSLQTGLSFAEINYRITAYGTYPVYVQNNNSYYAASPTRSISNLSLNAFAMSAAARPPVNYLHNSYVIGEIPLLINKQFGNSHGVNFNLGAGAGLSYLFHASPVIYSSSTGRYLTDNQYIRPVNGEFLVEPSLLIPLSSHLKLDAGPSFQYQILSSYKNFPAVREHPYFIGLKTGLQWGR